jgi:isoquinoline 1-oxidoreductase subunit beta
MDELAHAAGKAPYRYRRELIARTDLPYKADMIRALDIAAEMSGWGTPLSQGTARAIALEERGADGGGTATISAMVHTVSISKKGDVRLLRVDVAHEEGFGFVNPLTVRKQLEGQIVWFWNDAMHQACHVEGGRIVENNFDIFPLSRINEEPPEINIASSRPAIGCAAWGTTVAPRSNPPSQTPFSRSRESGFGSRRSAVMT